MKLTKLLERIAYQKNQCIFLETEDFFVNQCIFLNLCAGYNL